LIAQYNADLRHVDKAVICVMVSGGRHDSTAETDSTQVNVCAVKAAVAWTWDLGLASVTCY